MGDLTHRKMCLVSDLELSQYERFVTKENLTKFDFKQWTVGCF